MTTRINPKSDSYEALMWDVVTNAHHYIPCTGDRVLDLGASRGMFSLFCAARGCAVKAYEPNIELMDDLCWASEVAEEIGVGSIEIFPHAVWSRSGTGLLFSRSDSSAAATLLAGKDGRAVPCVSLHEALEGQHFECVKVDIEGAEAEVFLNASVEDLARIFFLTMEIHNDLLPLHTRQLLLARLRDNFPHHEAIPVKVNGVPTSDVATLLCWR